MAMSARANKPNNNQMRSNSISSNAENPDNACVVCFKNVEIYSIGECDHPVCFECSTRMRVLCKQFECPICRQMLTKVIFTYDKLPYRELEAKNRSEFFNTTYKICFYKKPIQQAFESLLTHPCPKCDGPVFHKFVHLREHVRTKHNHFYCDLCTDNLKIFSFERRCYSKEELSMHLRRGDPDNKSHRGHPLCEYCDKRYLDRDELFRHLRREHYFCHFCDADGSNEFYKDYESLRNHFRKDHYLCEEGKCATEQFTGAFRTEIDYKAHVANIHGKSLNKQQAKQARTLQLEITLGPRGRSGQTEPHIASLRSRGHNEPEVEQQPEIPPPVNPQRALPLDSRNEQDFPSLGNGAPALNLVPIPMAMRMNVGSSGLARTKENFPALGGSESGGGNGPSTSRSKQTSISSIIKKNPSSTPNSMLIHVSNRPSTSSGATSKKPNHSNKKDFPSLPGSSKAAAQAAIREDFIASNSNINYDSVSAKHRSMMDDYVSVANPNNFHKLQLVQKEAEEAKIKKAALETSAPKLDSTAFPALSMGNKSSPPLTPSWTKSQKQQRESENRKSKVAPAPLLNVNSKQKNSKSNVQNGNSANTNNNNNNNNYNNNSNTSTEYSNKKEKKNKHSGTEGKKSPAVAASSGNKQQKKSNNNENKPANANINTNVIKPAPIVANGNVKNLQQETNGQEFLHRNVGPPPGFSSAPTIKSPSSSQKVTLNSVAKLPNNLTFTSSLGESYNIVPSYNYMPPPEAITRNQIVPALDNDMNSQEHNISSSNSHSNNTRISTEEFKNTDQAENVSTLPVTFAIEKTTNDNENKPPNSNVENNLQTGKEIKVTNLVYRTVDPLPVFCSPIKPPPGFEKITINAATTLPNGFNSSSLNIENLMKPCKILTRNQVPPAPDLKMNSPEQNLESNVDRKECNDMVNGTNDRTSMGIEENKNAVITSSDKTTANEPAPTLDLRHLDNVQKKCTSIFENEQVHRTLGPPPGFCALVKPPPGFEKLISNLKPHFHNSLISTKSLAENCKTVLNNNLMQPPPHQVTPTSLLNINPKEQKSEPSLANESNIIKVNCEINEKDEKIAPGRSHSQIVYKNKSTDVNATCTELIENIKQECNAQEILIRKVNLTPGFVIKPPPGFTNVTLNNSKVKLTNSIIFTSSLEDDCKSNDSFINPLEDFNTNQGAPTVILDIKLKEQKLESEFEDESSDTKKKEKNKKSSETEEENIPLVPSQQSDKNIIKDISADDTNVAHFQQESKNNEIEHRTVHPPPGFCASIRLPKDFESSTKSLVEICKIVLSHSFVQTSETLTKNQVERNKKHSDKSNDKNNNTITDGCKMQHSDTDGINSSVKLPSENTIIGKMNAPVTLPSENTPQSFETDNETKSKNANVKSTLLYPRPHEDNVQKEPEVIRRKVRAPPGFSTTIRPPPGFENVNSTSLQHIGNEHKDTVQLEKHGAIHRALGPPPCFSALPPGFVNVQDLDNFGNEHKENVQRENNGQAVLHPNIGPPPGFCGTPIKPPPGFGKLPNSLINIYSLEDNCKIVSVDSFVTPLEDITKDQASSTQSFNMNSQEQNGSRDTRNTKNKAENKNKSNGTKGNNLPPVPCIKNNQMCAVDKHDNESRNQNSFTNVPNQSLEANEGVEHQEKEINEEKLEHRKIVTPPGFSVSIKPSSGFEISLEESNDNQKFITRNQNLVAFFKDVFKSPESVDEFRQLSQRFREGVLTAQSYYEHCQAALRDNFDSIFPEFLSLLPDINKQQELFLVHSQRLKALPSGDQKKLSSKLKVCPNCKQVLSVSDADNHYKLHAMQDSFPMLGKSDKKGNTMTASRK